ncbi:NERD domain-containing protein [Neobacillus sp. MM2021_6]|uniref:nuclease-related domain-containing protein n=1 Tax=Bacillaceae TaxID=186817 RepID=UPI00140C44BD|nr:MULTISPECIES: nuclease-related domain-containing protein [Bacillaceae]MBO0958876.1 NERD domain-containing protein [Neobacillus sp. MM2021_6]NHC17605.1 NERD domain-containing protein [Bacillus sp. MM2020_4]
MSHQKYQQISDECGRRQAGYLGEKSMDYYYRDLPNQKYTILHDLNLPDGDYNCQIDTLLLTPEFALAIDVKNLAGKLLFDTDNEQLIQINNGKEKGYPYPIAQAERHKKHLQKLLAAHHFPPVPVEYLVVISNPYTSYVITGKNAYKVKPYICKADIFLKKIELLEKQYLQPLLTAKYLRKLCRRLVKMNTLPINYLLKKYGIQNSDLLTGIHCPSCSHQTLIRKKQNWYCSSCHSFSKDAHIEALKDYFLLFGSTITNKQFRDFAHLESRHIAKRILQSCSFLEYSGKNRYRYYSPKIFPW